MRENTSLTAWRADGQTIGCWLSLGNAYSAEAIARMGFDWVCVDMQHGLIDYQDLTYMLPAISRSSATPLVRVPWNEPYEIMKALDAGAYGVIVPMVLKTLGIDPALASSIFVTTFTDVMGFFLFLGLATRFLPFGVFLRLTRNLVTRA